LQQGLPILETDPVDPKLDGAFILLGCGIPVAEAAGVGILDHYLTDHSINGKHDLLYHTMRHSFFVRYSSFLDEI